MTTLVKIQGWAEQGGSAVTVSGLTSTPIDFQQSFPLCTVTIYLTGTTTLASLFQDSGGVTPQSNPFTSSSTGYWGAFVATGSYDVTFSGAGISVPFTISAVNIVASIAGNIAFIDAANVFTQNQRINGKLGFNTNPSTDIDLLSTSSSVTIQATSSLSTGTASLRLQGDSEDLSLGMNSSAVAGNAYSGGPLKSNLAFLNNVSGDILLHAVGSSSLWLATNSATRAKINSSALESTVPLQLDGSTSGSATLKAQSSAGSYTFALPNVDPTVGQNLYVASFSGGTVTFAYQNNGSLSSGFEGICRYDIQRDFGASGSSQTTTGSMSASTNTLTVASSIDFSIGQGICIINGASGPKNLITKIDNLVGTTITTHDPCTNPSGVSGVKVQHDDSAVINTAISTVVSSGGGNIFFPKGTYRVNGPLVTNCNGIIGFPQILRTSNPVPIGLIGESGPPVTGSSVLPTNGVVLDAQDWNDSTPSNYAAIISAKTFTVTSVVSTNQFNWIEPSILNMTIRNKPNPDLTAVNMHNAEGFLADHIFIDAGEPLSFTTAAGFTVLTQPTNSTNPAVGIVTPALNNIGAQEIANSTVIGHYIGLMPGDNAYFRHVYVIQNAVGMRFNDNVSMVHWYGGGIYEATTAIDAIDPLGLGNHVIDADIQIECYTGTGNWWDTPAGHRIYDPTNLIVGTIKAMMNGTAATPGKTGGLYVDVLSSMTRDKFYSLTGDSARMSIAQTKTTDPEIAGQLLLTNSGGDFLGLYVPGSSYIVSALRRNGVLQAANDQFFSVGSSNTFHFQFSLSGTDALTIEPFFGVGRTTVHGIAKIPIPQYPPNTPAQITTDQNNYAPGSGGFQRWSSSGPVNVTGLTAGQDGESMEIWNVGSQNIVLKNESASSTATNRFHNSTGADITLAGDQVAFIRYDATTTRWRVTKGN